MPLLCEKKILFGDYKPLEFIFINQLFRYLNSNPFQRPSTRPKGSVRNLLAQELFFFILAHPVYKM
jgi:hypothetical protein